MKLVLTLQRKHFGVVDLMMQMHRFSVLCVSFRFEAEGFLTKLVTLSTMDFENMILGKRSRREVATHEIANHPKKGRHDDGVLADLNAENKSLKEKLRIAEAALSSGQDINPVLLGMVLRGTMGAQFVDGDGTSLTALRNSIAGTTVADIKKKHPGDWRTGHVMLKAGNDEALKGFMAGGALGQHVDAMTTLKNEDLKAACQRYIWLTNVESAVYFLACYQKLHMDCVRKKTVKVFTDAQTELKKRGLEKMDGDLLMPLARHCETLLDEVDDSTDIMVLFATLGAHYKDPMDFMRQVEPLRAEIVRRVASKQLDESGIKLAYASGLEQSLLTETVRDMQTSQSMAGLSDEQKQRICDIDAGVASEVSNEKENAETDEDESGMELCPFKDDCNRMDCGNWHPTPPDQIRRGLVAWFAEATKEQGGASENEKDHASDHSDASENEQDDASLTEIDE